MTTSGFGDDDRRITIGLEDGEHVEADPEHHRERQWIWSAVKSKACLCLRLK